MGRIRSEDLAKRAGVWAATLRDDAATLRQRANSAGVDGPLRADLLGLARSLNRAAKILDIPAGLARKSTKKSGEKESTPRTSSGTPKRLRGRRVARPAK